ncbi:MAG TPA: MarR family transcriptional regulator [Acidimicrobiales bacterium]|nr:MarR family transcriptional regulator [Acidimicrobiales bacterium]
MTISDEDDRQMARAVRVLARLTRFVERACQESQLSLPQYRLLLFVAGASQRAGELASRAAVSRPTLTSLIDGLEKEGLVERLRVSGDRRGINLRLTDAGKNALRTTEALLKERLCHLVEDDADHQLVQGLIGVGAVLDRDVVKILAKRADGLDAPPLT